MRTFGGEEDWTPIGRDPLAEGKTGADKEKSKMEGARSLLNC